jgi:NADPH:quinone reductase-like Zn-dependent oxidoreductase
LASSPGEYGFGDVDLPAPGPRQVVVDVVASALNHLDLWLRAGMPAPKALPIVPGCDGAGVVAALGPGPTRWQVGDEVVINPSFACGHCPDCVADRSVFCPEFGIMGEHRWGAHGRSVVVGEANLVARPAGRTWEEAGAYGLCGLTAYRMLRRARLRTGETLLVIGAGGGVATAALVLGQRIGARVFATSRHPAKRATAMSALRPGGRLVICGGTGGSKVELNLPRLFFGQYEVIGSTLGTFAEFEQLTALVTGGLPVVVDSVYPLAEYPAALDRLAAGDQFGKVVLLHR